MWKTCLAAAALCLMMANAALAAEFKIACVDMREILTASDAAKQSRAKMESKFGAERDKLEKQHKELQKQMESLKSPAAGQSRETLEQKRSDFLRKKQDLDQKVREYDSRLEKEGSQIQNEVMALITKTAKDFAGKKGISYFVDVSGSLYVDPSLDVTKEFLEEVNRQWKDSPGGKKK